MEHRKQHLPLIVAAGLLALGGLDYGPRRSHGEAKAADLPRGLDLPRGTNPFQFLQAASWAALPGSAREAESVSRAYREAVPDSSPRLLQGSEADTARLKRELTHHETYSYSRTYPSGGFAPRLR